LKTTIHEGALSNKTGDQGWDLKTTIHEGALSWEQFPGSSQGEF